MCHIAKNQNCYMKKITLFKTCCWDRKSRHVCFLLFLFLFQFTVLFAQAQNSKVMGAIKNSKGSPLAGVNVLLKGGKSGTATDAEGRFSIEIPNENAVLLF